MINFSALVERGELVVSVDSEEFPLLNLVLLHLLFLDLHNALFKQDGEELVLGVFEVDLGAESLGLDDRYVIELVSLVGVVGGAQINLLGVDHDENLPCLAVSRDSSVNGTSILVVEAPVIDFLSILYNNFVHVNFPGWIGQIQKHLQPIFPLFVREIALDLGVEAGGDHVRVLDEKLSPELDAFERFEDGKTGFFLNIFELGLLDI